MVAEGVWGLGFRVYGSWSWGLGFGLRDWRLGVSGGNRGLAWGFGGFGDFEVWRFGVRGLRGSEFDGTLFSRFGGFVLLGA